MDRHEFRSLLNIRVLFISWNVGSTIIFLGLVLLFFCGRRAFKIIGILFTFYFYFFIFVFKL